MNQTISCFGKRQAFRLAGLALALLLWQVEARAEKVQVGDKKHLMKWTRKQICERIDPLRKNEDLQGRREWALKCGLINKGSFTLMTRENQYPSFDLDLRAPVTQTASCEGFSSDILVVCNRDCFAEQTALWFQQQPLSWQQWTQLPQIPATVTTLAEDATLQHLTTAEHNFEPISAWRYQSSLVQIDLGSGQVISVTPGHPMVDARGNMVSASDLKPGDSLLTMAGAKPIVSLQSVDFDGYVWNVMPITSAAKGSVLVANGILSGGIGYLYDDAHALRVQLRQSLASKMTHK